MMVSLMVNVTLTADVFILGTEVAHALKVWTPWPNPSLRPDLWSFWLEQLNIGLLFRQSVLLFCCSCWNTLALFSAQRQAALFLAG